MRRSYDYLSLTAILERSFKDSPLNASSSNKTCRQHCWLHQKEDEITQTPRRQHYNGRRCSMPMSDNLILVRSGWNRTEGCPQPLGACGHKLKHCHHAYRTAKLHEHCAGNACWQECPFSGNPPSRTCHRRPCSARQTSRIFRCHASSPSQRCELILSPTTQPALSSASLMGTPVVSQSAEDFTNFPASDETTRELQLPWLLTDMIG